MIVRWLRGTVLWVGLTVAPTASAVKVEIGYVAPAQVAAQGDPVRVTFENARLPAEGGTELPLVGQLRSLAGVPYGTFTKKVHLDALMVGSTTAVLGSVGIGTVPDGGGSVPRVNVKVTRFWGDGNIGYGMYLDAVVQLFVDGPAPVWEEPVTLFAETKAFWSPKKELPRAYEALLQRYMSQMAEAFADESFRARLRGEPVAAVVTPAPAEPSGCGKDSDCKGERICRDAACVDPG